MDNTRRRAYIKEKLQQADHRLRGMDLAKECGVSRQVIVGDMALLRAEGMDIINKNGSDASEKLNAYIRGLKAGMAE